VTADPAAVTPGRIADGSGATVFSRKVFQQPAGRRDGGDAARTRSGSRRYR